jgi:carbamoyl-phosphate synthase large subunit
LTNILVTAAGSPSFIATCKALRAIDFLEDLTIHGCDCNPDTVGLTFADKSFIAPYGNSDSYIPEIYEYCYHNDIKIIIPASDGELLPLSKNKEVFAEIGCTVLVSNPFSLDSVMNKLELFSLCKKSPFLNLLCPEFVVCKNVKEFRKAFEYISSLGHQVCVKPVTSHGSRGFRIIEDVQSKEDFFSKKPNPRAITFENICEIFSQGDGTFPDLLVMEYLPGEEYSVDCMANGEDFYCVSRRRDIIKEGICSSGLAIKNHELIDFSKKLYKKFGLQYVANIQFRYDSSGYPKLLEINPRVSGTMELCRGAGLSFVELAIATAMNRKISSRDFEIKWGTKMVRIWEELFYYDDYSYFLESAKFVLLNKNAGEAPK